MGKPKVKQLEPNLWAVEYVEGEQFIANVFPYEGVPRVKAHKQPDGGTVLRTQHGVEVGRYNEAWAGEEVPCAESHDPQPVTD
jgi:hypothetical protein